MRPVSASRSALGTALVGTATILPLVLVALVAVVRWPPDFWTVNARVADVAINWRLPLLAFEAAAAPVALLITCVGFFVIGRRAAQPIEAARRSQLQFTADASHELRTPLTIIEGEASLALKRPRRRDEYRAALETIAAESRRMRALVDDLLWLARTEGEPERPPVKAFNLKEVVAGAVGRFRVLASIKNQLLADLSTATDAWLRAPDGWADRLLDILLENACRYTPAGGRIEVRAQLIGSSALLVVEDSGPGIPHGECDRIFDRFHRASDAGGGSGLGLAIANRIVAETGGAWKIGRSHLGGARMEVCWRSPSPAQRAAFTELSRTEP